MLFYYLVILYTPVTVCFHSKLVFRCEFKSFWSPNSLPPSSTLKLQVFNIFCLSPSSIIRANWEGQCWEREVEQMSSDIPLEISMFMALWDEATECAHLSHQIKNLHPNVLCPDVNGWESMKTGVDFSVYKFT